MPRGVTRCKDPCRDCPEDEKTHACYPDEEGKNNVLCAEHAHIAGSYQVQRPCRDCPEGMKREAAYPNEQGRNNILCAEHAHIAGCHLLRNPCRDCHEDTKKEAQVPRRGRKRRTSSALNTPSRPGPCLRGTLAPLARRASSSTTGSGSQGSTSLTSIFVRDAIPRERRRRVSSQDVNFVPMVTWMGRASCGFFMDAGIMVTHRATQSTRALLPAAAGDQTSTHRQCSRWKSTRL